MNGRHLPPDPSMGDESTVGGYAAVHARPPALEGRDGMSYSIEILTDDTGEPGRPVGAFLLFVRWKRFGDQGVHGHVETAFLAWGKTRAEAATELGAMSLAEAQRVLDGLLVAHDSGPSARRWWSATPDDGGGE